jgi:hypothetical protein
MFSLGKLVVLSLVLFGVSAKAHEGTFGTISGEKMTLYWSDHALSGHVGDHLIYGIPDSSEFKLNHRAHAENFSASMKSTKSGMGGKIASKDEAGKAVETAVDMTKFAKGVIEGTVDKDKFTLSVSSKTMNGNHYVDPEFELTVGTKTYEFKMENGQACLGCVGKIAFVVVGMLRSTGTL